MNSTFKKNARFGEIGIVVVDEEHVLYQENNSSGNFAKFATEKNALFALEKILGIWERFEGVCLVPIPEFIEAEKISQYETFLIAAKPSFLS